MDFESLKERLRDGVATHPRLTLALLLSALALVLGLLLAGPFLVIVLFSWTQSPKGTLIFAVWLLSALLLGGALLFSIRSRDHRYRSASRRMFDRGKETDPAHWRALAQAYLEGTHGLPLDASQAVYWLHRCAEAGDAEAAFQLARLIEDGHGHPLNRPLALKWLRRAAEGGHGPARHLLEVRERREDQP